MAAGASCIYSLLGAREYSWRFIASDIDELALQHAEELVAENDLKQQIVLSHLAELKNWCHGEHFVPTVQDAYIVLSYRKIELEHLLYAYEYTLIHFVVEGHSPNKDFGAWAEFLVHLRWFGTSFLVHVAKVF